MVVHPASRGLPRAPRYSRTRRGGAGAFDDGALTLHGGPFQALRLAPRAHARPLGRGPSRAAQPRPRNACRLHARGRFGLLPVRSPLLGECSLLLGVLRCFSSPAYPPAAYVFGRGYRAITPGELPHSGIDDASLACSPSSLFAACRALHRPVSPRHPPHTLLRVKVLLFDARQNSDHFPRDL